MPHRDLSLAEQENVRAYLRALRARFGNWRNVERSLPVAHSVLVDMMSGRCEVSVTIAFHAAKVLDASIYDVIAGKALPADTCRHCGKEASEHWRCAGRPAGVSMDELPSTGHRSGRLTILGADAVPMRAVQCYKLCDSMPRHGG